MAWVVIGLLAIAALIFNLIDHATLIINGVQQSLSISTSAGGFGAIVATILLGISAVLMERYR